MEDNPFDQIRQQVEKGRGRDIQTIDHEEKPLCPICKGRGWVVLAVPPEHEDFSASCPCTCALKEFISTRWERSGLAPKAYQETFDTFDRRRKGVSEGLEAAEMLVKGELQLVVLTGNCGAGKTHLAHAVIIEALEMGGSAKIIRAADWLDDLKDAFGDEDKSMAESMKTEVNRIPVLALDELKYRTKFDEETIDNLITRRLTKGLRTMITSNQSPKDLRMVFPRVISRASDPRFGRCLWMDTTDYRDELARRGNAETK